MTETEKDTPTPAKSGKTKWIVMFGILIFLALAIKFLLPSSFSNDLSVVGKGTPTMVLVRDQHTVQSIQLLDLMDEVRGAYSGRVGFLVVDWNTPKGIQFMEDHQAQRASIVMLAGDGRLAGKMFMPQTADSMDQLIKTTFGVTP